MTIVDWELVAHDQERELASLRQDLDMANACKEMWIDRHDYIEHIYKELLDQHDRNTNVVVRLAEELAALKQNAEQPVAWEWFSQADWECYERAKDLGCLIEPPTATALVADFKRKIVWMLDTITADVRFQSKDCYRMADQLRHDIESLPLIEGGE